MNTTEQETIEVTLDALDETVNELERLMALLAERLGAKPVTHYQDKKPQEGLNLSSVR